MIFVTIITVMTLILVIQLYNAGTDSDDTAVVNNWGGNIYDNKNVVDENNYDDNADDTYEWYNNAGNNNTGDSHDDNNVDDIDIDDDYDMHDNEELTVM
eukprot:gene11425-biopygen6595